MLGSLQDKMAPNEEMQTTLESAPQRGSKGSSPTHEPQGVGVQLVHGPIVHTCEKLVRDMININRFNGIEHKNGTRACMHL